MRKGNVLRMTRTHLGALTSLFRTSGYNESQAFALCSRADGEEECIFIVRMLLLPDAGDLVDQTAMSVAPTAEFQAIAYGLAHDLEMSVFDFHTHPWADKPCLSGVDLHHGRENARYVAGRLGSRSTMGMAVFGGSMQGFDGRVWDRLSSDFQDIDCIEVLGAPTTVLVSGITSGCAPPEVYARQTLIPNWDQAGLQRQKVFIAGLGGNGSLIFQAILGLGIGEGGGWVKACDPDVLEDSNLPRIPYAATADIGKPKAEIAQAYAEQKAPDTRVTCYKADIRDTCVLAAAKEAHVLIGAVDNHGGT